MIGNKTSRLLLIAVPLSIAVAAVMLFVFNEQNRWQERQIVDASSTEYRSAMADAFERSARLQLHATFTNFQGSVDGAQASDIFVGLNTILIEIQNLTGVRYVDPSGQVFEAGSISQLTNSANTTWLAERLLITQPVNVHSVTSGSLTGSFDLSELNADTSRFATSISASESDRRQGNYYWAGAGSFAVTLLAAFVVWLLLRSQTRRIRN